MGLAYLEYNPLFFFLGGGGIHKIGESRLNLNN